MNEYIHAQEPQMVPIDELKVYDGNAKKHTRAQLDAVEASIKEFGFRGFVIAWHNEDGVPEIVAGHARTTAARNLGMDAVPVVFCDDLTDAQRRALTLADNQTTMMTGWDEDQLAYELETLSDAFDMCDFGFDISDGVDVSEIVEDEFTDDVEDRVKLGEVWRMGDHVLLCGDATKPENVAKLLESLESIGGGRSADMILTDPPYNVALGQHYRPSELKQLHRRQDGLCIENDSWDDDEGFVQFLVDALGNAATALKDGGAFYIWYASTQSANFLEAVKRVGLQVRQLLVWVKNTFAMGRQDYQWRHEPCLYGWKDGAAHNWYSDRRQSTVLEFDKPSVNAEHPTMKPVALFAYQIQNSTKRGDTVLDPFLGSGTSIIAAEKTDRRCIGFELDEHYASVIVNRWEELTGDKAVRLQ